MPDIPPSSQATISQALNQLSRVAPTSDLARQGAEVLVKHLAGNVLSLSTSSILTNRTVALNSPQISGKIADGQTHQLKITAGETPRLEFYSQSSAKSTSTIVLTDQQTQNILRLPVRQLLPSQVQITPQVLAKLPAINASVLPAPSQGITDGNNPVGMSASQGRALNQQTMLRLSLTDLRPPVELTLPTKTASPFAAGDKVTIMIAPKGSHWQVTIVQNKSDLTGHITPASDDKVLLKTPPLASSPSTAVISNKLSSPLLAQSTQVNAGATEARVTNHLEGKKVVALQSILSPTVAAPLIKASLVESSLSKPTSVDLPIKAVLQQLGKSNNEQNLGLVQKLQTLSIDKLSLQARANGELNLLVQSSKPVATVPITMEIAQALAPLKLPNQQAITRLLHSPADLTNQSPAAPRTTQVDSLSKTGNSGPELVPSVDGSKVQEMKLSLKEAESRLIASMQEKPMLQSVISPSLLANKTEQLNLIQSLLRIVQSRAEAPASVLQSLDTALNDTEFFKGITEQPSKKIIDQVLQQIKQALPQGKDQDMSQIRQLLTTPPLNLSGLQMANPTSSQGLMGGLVTLLQMSLSARLSRNQSNRAGHITATLNNVLAGISPNKSSVSPKAMGDLAQLDQKHQLMKEIGRLLSGHQTSKLANAEQMLQGQDSFYYNLPSAFGGNVKDVEILIKREEDSEQSDSTDEQENKTWQLTMKLAVGELGELLTKAKLGSDALDINFYASNEEVKIQVLNYLPLLRRKLESLGIEVRNSQCQLGKIPDTLQQRPYHMFQTKA